MSYTIHSPHDDNCIECQMLQVFKLYVSEFITFCDFIINVSQSRNRWCTKGYLFLTVFVLWLQRSGSFFGVFFFSILYLGVLVWRFNFMRKESDHKDNVIGFLNLFMVMELVSLTKLSSNLGASVTEIATKLLTIKSPVK